MQQQYLEILFQMMKYLCQEFCCRIFWYYQQDSQLLLCRILLLVGCTLNLSQILTTFPFLFEKNRNNTRILAVIRLWNYFKWRNLCLSMFCFCYCLRFGWVAASPFGYAFALNFYQGKFRGTATEYKSKFGLGGEVVLDFLDILSKSALLKKIFLFTPTIFFTSVGLLEEVTKKGHRATGTIRSNRTEKCPFSNNKSFGKLPQGSEEHFLERLKRFWLLDGVTMAL